MKDTIYYENNEILGTWNQRNQRIQLKNAWKEFLEKGSNHLGLEYYLTIKFRQKKSYDEIRDKINPNIKKLLSHKFRYSMNFVFFIERGVSSDTFHSHLLFSLPRIRSLFGLNNTDPEFIEKDLKIRSQVNNVLKRFTCNPSPTPFTDQIDRMKWKYDQITNKYISIETRESKNRISEITNRPYLLDVYENRDKEIKDEVDKKNNRIKRIMNYVDSKKVFSNKELDELKFKSQEPNKLIIIPSENEHLKRIYWSGGLVLNYQLKELGGENYDCFDIKNSDLSAL